MNLALALATQLLLGQSDPAQEPSLEAETTTGDQVETDAQAIRDLNDRLAALEARIAEMEQQGTAKDEELAALREQAAALQESAAAPGEAADLQRATRELRVRSVENALQFVVQAYEIIETGEEDVSGSIGAAYAALDEGRALASEAGSPAEVQRFEAALQAVAAVPGALAERDYQQAKYLLMLTAAEGRQALFLARSNATLPVTQTTP